MGTDVGVRHLCSDLTTVHLRMPDGSKRELVGNLEEIDTTGACVQLEEPLEAETTLRFICTNCERPCEFNATVVSCHHQAGVGYYVDVRFTAGEEWSPERYRPNHLLHPGELLELESKPQCCDRGVCPKEEIACLLDPGVSLAQRVRDVGEEVAFLCSGLSDQEAGSCFESLFGAGTDCRLFHIFLSAYRRAQCLKPLGRKRSLRRRIEHFVQSAGSIPPAAVESTGCLPEAVNAAG